MIVLDALRWNLDSLLDFPVCVVGTVWRSPSLRKDSEQGIIAITLNLPSQMLYIAVEK
jgi:hypothetical protein